LQWIADNFVFSEFRKNYNQSTQMGNTSSVELARRRLVKASLVGNVDDVALAMRQGASIDQADKFGWTALHHACTEGHLRCVQYMLGKRPELLELENGEKATPLILSITSLNAKLVELLLRAGANVNHQQQEGLTALHSIYICCCCCCCCCYYYYCVVVKRFIINVLVSCGDYARRQSNLVVASLWSRFGREGRAESYTNGFD
jgi:hypothetical protein